MACPKVAYASYQKAEAAMLAVKRKRNGEPRREAVRLGVYRCSKCMAWHFGHSPRPESERRGRVDRQRRRQEIQEDDDCSES